MEVKVGGDIEALFWRWLREIQWSTCHVKLAAFMPWVLPGFGGMSQRF
jgi:hypothetical protein